MNNIARPMHAVRGGSRRTADRNKHKTLRFEPLERRELLDVAGIDIDPGDRLMNSLVLGEWNTPGDFEDWQVVAGTNETVSGGSLTVDYPLGAGSPLQLDLEDIPVGPDLDFGYYDYLQVRLALPLGYDGDLNFSFGTTTHGGFSTARTFEVPAAEVLDDGGWHTYRLDLGLETWWRDTLTDLRIEPLGDVGTGDSVSIDYIEVGDLPGDVLLVNTNLNIKSGETFGDLDRMESKHFTFWWSPESYVVGPNLDPAIHGRRALRMLEESYQVYAKVLDYDEPFENSNIAMRDGNRYKVNHTTWYNGYWMGSMNGFGYINVGESGLRDEGWGNPVPHEFAHVVDGAQQGFLVGGHWESHANYLRENRTFAFAELFPSDQRSTLDMRPFEFSNFRQDHGRLIYGDYRIHLALQDYADELGLDPDIAAQLWMEGSKNWTVYEKLDTLLPADVTVQDVVGTTMRYWPLLDFEYGAEMQGQMWTTADEKATFEFRTGSMLIPSADNPGWYRVPFEKAPEKFGYMYHELTPDSSTMTVEFRGMDVIGAGEGWRWSLAAVDASGNVRYSDVWEPGTHSFTLNPGENRVLLVVVATPDDLSLDLTSYHNTKPTDKHPDRLHYPYEVRLVGATPSTHQLDWAKGSGHYHSNGGGWVDNTATVASTVYVGPNARVLDSARVYGNARIEDYAVVANTATVQENAIISGYAAVIGNARVEDNAVARDRALIEGSAVVRGNAVVEEYARVEGGAVIEGSAIARGSTWTFGGVISGTAILDHDYSFDFDYDDGVHFSHVPWGGWYEGFFGNSQKKTRGLVASYRTEATEGEALWDEFGAEHAVLRGGLQRVEDAQMNSRVLELNGLDQYVVLDRSVADLDDGSLSIWFKATTADVDQSLLYFGSSPDTFLKLTGRNAQGNPQLTISLDGQVDTLVANQVTNIDEWTHLVVTFGAGTAKIYVNGTLAGQAAVSATPRDVLGPNDYLSAEHLYAGRDAAGNYFQGRLEDIRFYNVTLDQSEVDTVNSRAGSRIGHFFADTAEVFDGATTTYESGVHNGLVRTLAASIKPASSDNVSYYEAVLDANDERDGGKHGSGFGLDNGEIVVRLDRVGFWSTGIQVQIGQWQHVALTFDGSLAELYVDGTRVAQKSYSAGESDLAGKNYRIGWGQSGEDVSTRTYFDGEITDVQIFDRVVILPEWHGPNTPPDAVDDNATVMLYVAADVDVLANDSDAEGDALSIQSFTQGAHGTVTDNGDGTLRYLPNIGYIGTDTFEYMISDGFGGTDTATVNVTIISPAAPPAATHHWKFDESSGTFTDDSAGSADGTLTNMDPSTDRISGRDGKALDFDGGNDYVNVGSTPDNTLSGTASMTFWVRTTQTGDDSYWQAPGIAGVENSGGANDVFWGWLDASGRIGLQGGSTAGAKSSLPINDGTWHHIALTRNSGSGAVAVYVDGTLSGEATSAAGTMFTSFSSLGRIEDTGGSPEYFQGQLDDVRVFGSVLSLEQVVGVMLDVQSQSSQNDGSISITLGGPKSEGDDDLAPSDVAGVHPAQNWNDLTSSSASVSSTNLVDSYGNAVGVNFSASGAGTGQFNAIWDANSKFMSSFLSSGSTDPNDPNAINITIEDIPYSRYDLYIYVDSYANFRGGRTDDYSVPGFLLRDGIGGTEIDTYYGQNQTDYRIVQTFAEYTTTDLAAAEARALSGSPGSPVGNDNYLLIEGLTATDLQILGYKASAAAWDMIGVNAVQIVANAAPSVEYVLVRGDNWSDSLLDALDAQGMGHSTVPRLGYRIPAGSQQLDTLPWDNIDTMTVVFSSDVGVSAGDLSLSSSPDGAAAPTISGFNQINSYTAQWQFASALQANKYLITLEDTIVDGKGNALDGEWADGASNFPSGDGNPGGDFNLRFNVLPGDGNQSGMVNVREGVEMRGRLGSAIGDAGYSHAFDFNGDSFINASDNTIIRSNLFVSLPFGEPELLLSPAPAGFVQEEAIAMYVEITPTAGTEEQPALGGLNRLDPLSFAEYRTTTALAGMFRPLRALPDAELLRAKSVDFIHNVKSVGEVFSSLIGEVADELDDGEQCIFKPTGEHPANDVLFGKFAKNNHRPRNWRALVDDVFEHDNWTINPHF